MNRILGIFSTSFVKCKLRRALLEMAVFSFPSTPLKERAEWRDVKGLYAKADAGSYRILLALTAPMNRRKHRKFSAS
jgi:adenylylsulfate kinase-like enzyme